MTPRLPHRDEQWLANLRASYEGWLAKHVAALPEAPEERRLYAWAAVENDYRQLSLISYAEGQPLERVRSLLLKSARAHLQVVSLRGTAPATGAEPPDGYSTGNSRSTYLAICRSMAAGDVGLARELAPFLWDPAKARYIGPGSTVGTVRAQAVAYALKELLLDERSRAQVHLDTVQRAPEDLIGELLMVQALVSAEPARFLKGISMALAWHSKQATKHPKVVDLFVCIPALGLAAYAMNQALVSREELPTDQVYLPVDVITRDAGP